MSDFGSSDYEVRPAHTRQTLGHDNLLHTKIHLSVMNKFRKRLDREKSICNYASCYYSTLNSRFVVPGIIITGISSVVSFLATSSLLTTRTKEAFIISVGILTAFSTILQSVSSSFGFTTRAEAFQKIADTYDALITKLEFEMCNPNEVFIDFCNKLETDILKIKNECKFMPPLFIIEKYEKDVAKLVALEKSKACTKADDYYTEV